ncbi:C-C motif chemokine 13-like [Triplophysa dalaica]|uniref:C-C motif chemokine 13-like n=1 Tax=Triplophysa dalaica TaxID=1582913 RepID=UPI0024DFE1F7|nr:C-C motif chemokine 13-like [Triplophysa dalaica]
MRTTVCLILGLVLLGILDCEAQPHGPPIPATCCFSFIGFQIPANKIKSAVETSPSCVNRAVVVTTEKGNTFCVKSNEPWLPSIKKDS